jgi:hypothetical protein
MKCDKLIKQTICIIILIFALLFSTTANAAILELEIAPKNPEPGDEITISGVASPNQEITIANQEITIASSFKDIIQVSAGKYKYDLKDIEIPSKPNSFTVTTKNVKNLRVGVKILIWITKSFPASGGVATLSLGDVPPGNYAIKIFGDAANGASTVDLHVTASLKTKADSNGNFKAKIGTKGLPPGIYTITAKAPDGASKTISVFAGEQPAESEPEPTPSLISTPTKTTMPTIAPTITPIITPTPIIIPLQNRTPAPSATTTPMIISVTPTPTPVPIPTTPVSAPVPKPKRGIPGFEAIFSIGGLLAVAYLFLRKKKKRFL